MGVVELASEVCSGGAGGLGDPDEEESEPAQDDIGADMSLEPVVDGPQADDLLHVAPVALDVQQLFVTQRHLITQLISCRRRLGSPLY